MIVRANVNAFCGAGVCGGVIITDGHPNDICFTQLVRGYEYRISGAHRSRPTGHKRSRLAGTCFVATLRWRVSRGVCWGLSRISRCSVFADPLKSCGAPPRCDYSVSQFCCCLRPFWPRRPRLQHKQQQKAGKFNTKLWLP